MIIDSYDITSEPIVKLENFYGEKQHLIKKCMVILARRYKNTCVNNSHADRLQK